MGAKNFNRRKEKKNGEVGAIHLCPGSVQSSAITGEGTPLPLKNPIFVRKTKKTEPNFHKFRKKFS